MNTEVRDMGGVRVDGTSPGARRRRAKAIAHHLQRAVKAVRG